MTSLNALAAQEHRADLIRAARKNHSLAQNLAQRTDQTTTLALRLALADEAPVVDRLAELDDAPHLEGAILLAIVDGEPVAAISLSDGRVVADPFRRTEEPVALLLMRAAQVSGRRRQRRRVRALLRPRFA